MIDTHSHINTEAFNEDREEVLERAWNAGLTAVVVPDIKPDTREKLVAIVDANHRLYRGIGIHPHHVGEISDDEIEIVEQQCKQSKVVAVGEIGLDYYYDFCPPEVQKSYFRAQIGIAKRNGLPIIVHNRDADVDVLDIIEQEQDGSLRGVLHCFSSDVAVLKRAIGLGLLVSFTGNITFKKSTLDDVVREVPDDRFMIETDAPYITPVPHRGKRNEPSYVRYIAERIAELRNMTVEQVETITTKTARAFFGLVGLLMVAVACAYAQPTPPNEDDFDNDRDWEIALDNYFADSVAYAKWIKPRKLGVGFSIGTNTTVEGQQFVQQYKSTDSAHSSDPSQWILYPRGTGPERSFSFPGIATYGVTLTYGLVAPLVMELTYLYAKNDQPAKDYGLDPIVTNTFELTALYSLNPYNKVNFMPQAGLTYASIDDGTNTSSKLGMNAGLGLGVNIPTPFGLFYPMFNVRFNFMFGTDLDRVVGRFFDPTTKQVYTNSADPTMKSEDKADVTTIYSITRFTLVYYLPFD